MLGTGSTIPVHVYTRSDACGAAETFAAWLGAKQEDLEGTAVFGDPGVTSVVQRDKVGSDLIILPMLTISILKSLIGISQ